RGFGCVWGLVVRLLLIVRLLLVVIGLLVVVGRGRIGLAGSGVGVIYDDRCGSGSAADGPDEGDDPADEGPAEEEVEQEDAAGAGAPANEGDDRRQEVRDEEQAGDGPAEYEREKEEQEGMSRHITAY